jgi:DNA-directed RNA polymerase subunit L
MTHKTIIQSLTVSFPEATSETLEVLAGIIEYGNHSYEVDAEDEDCSVRSTLQETIEAIEASDMDDFTIEHDGNEYRVISDSSIWDIYVDEIKNIVNDCYDLKLNKLPDFIAVSIDWGQTAQNAFADGYGHTFSSYDGEEVETANFHIFRTN